MTRLPPKANVIRALFARSGNQCAFPGCIQPLINRKNQFIAQICHIEAAEKGGERYNAKSTDGYRRSYENLLILCYPHHVETNDTREYSVNRLKQIKKDHEQAFERLDFTVNESLIIKLSHEMNKYWSDINRLNKFEHIFLDSGLEMEVKSDSTFSDVIESIYETVKGIEELFKSLQLSDEKLIEDLNEILIKKEMVNQVIDDALYYKSSFFNRNWEIHNLGTYNWLQRLRIDLVHIEVIYLEQHLKSNSSDIAAQARFKDVKAKLSEYARSAMYYD